jgi:hypothetical protein
MSCFNNYVPQPSRDWSRVQNSCIELSLSETNKIAISNKANVLQYKANSSNLTKAQKYSNIAKGFNNNTTWATQSSTRKYTNPNTKNLKRTDNILSCPQIVIPIDENLLFNIKYVNTDISTRSMPEDISTRTMPQDISTSSMPQDISTRTMPQNISTGSMPQDISTTVYPSLKAIYFPDIFTPVKVEPTTIQNGCNNSLPEPPRVWYRVQNPFIELSPLEAEKIAMLNKGNVLQYKANSSNLTKAQKYSNIAKGLNNNTTWATQSTRGYTNPNTTSLKRTGNVLNIAISSTTGDVIGPTLEPITCPKPIITINENLPSNIANESDTAPDIPPPVEPTPGSNVFPNIIPVAPVEPVVIQDGGVLICSVQENVCTGETKSTISQQLCNPTTDSNVPGPIQELCWNDGTETWYPRQRYIMTNSGNKFPYNYKF